jgi:hypothetical protein
MTAMLQRFQQGPHFKDLQKLGFTRAPSALAPEEVRAVRAICEEVHHRTGEDWMDPQALFATSSIATLPFRPHSVALMRELLGDEFYVVPDFAMNLGKYGVWHRDTGSQLLDGLKYVFDRDFLHLTFGLYFQENHPVFGGGLDVLPGSHKRLTPFRSTKLENIRDKVRLRLGARYPIPNNPGDLLAFNFRIFHSASLPQRPRPPDMPLRVAFFWGAVKKKRHALAYLQHLRDRAARDSYFERLLPPDFRFPETVRKAAHEAGVRLMPD